MDKQKKVRTSNRGIWITLLIFLVLPHVISTPLATEIMIFGLFALGFNLLLGSTGIVSFGHAAYFGLGCYGCGMAIRYFSLSVWSGLLVSMVLGALLAAVIGALAIKKRGVYFAMISMAVAQMFYFMALSPLKKWTGGEDGLKFIPPLSLKIPFFVDLQSPFPLYYFVYFIVGVSILVIWRILNSPFGRLLQAIRENETRTIASGYNVTMAKFFSLVFSGLFSALAGGLFCVYLGYGPLSALYWLTSGTILLMTILGGMHTFIGPIVGVAVFLYAQNKFSWILERWELVVGILFMALILIFPEGIVGTIKSRYLARKAVVQEVGLRKRMEPMAYLEARNLCKHFGGLKAVDRVNFKVEEGQLKSIIGPNGAGKTTLFNLLCGLYEPTTGEIFFRGKDITKKKMNQTSQLGITKTFQITHIFPRLTAFENVRISAQSRKTSFNFWQRADRLEAINAKTLRILEMVQLGNAYDRPASTLSHGERKYLEIGIALATDPKLLLLDEPTAGMSPAETTLAMKLIRSLRDELKLTILLVEHDMRVVMNISDEVFCLNEGKELACGSPEQISCNEVVQKVYLGGTKAC
jgi:ABC-type branched-subunit amino acid transport system ATPase component/ABC-type branched-subunit amino acid transport system permease subunit